MVLHFGKTLRYLRTEKGLSQQQLAERLHVERASVTNWEAGRRIPSIDMLSQISEALGVDATALMAAAGDMGASVAPQMLGIVVDRVSVSEYAMTLAQTASMTPEEVGLKTGMLIAAIFPLLGTGLVLVIRHIYKNRKTAAKQA